MLFNRRSRIEWLIFGLVALILGGFIGQNLYGDYGQIEAGERARLLAQADVVDQNLGQQLLAVDRSLASIRDDLPITNSRDAGMHMFNRRLQAMSDAMPGVRSLGILAADGVLIASNREQVIGQNFSDREYFRVARQSDDGVGLYISSPIRTVLGAYAMNVSKAVRDSRGRFAGVVFATLDPEHFNILMNSVRYAPDMFSALIHGDGKMVFKVPDEQGIVGTDLAKPGTLLTRHMESGQTTSFFRGIVPTVGEERLTVLHSIRPAGVATDKLLVLAFSRELSALYAPWRKEAYLQCGVFVLLLFSGALSLLLHQRRGRAHDALEEIERSLHQAQEHGHVGSYVYDIQADFWRSSPMMDRIFGISAQYPRDLAGWTGIIHPEDRAQVNAYFRDVVARHLRFEMEYRIVRVGDGVERWVMGQGETEYGADGAPMRLAGTIQDITEHKNAADKIQRLARLFATQSQCNKAIVRCASADDLLPAICRDAVVFGGMKMAWIAMVDKSGDRVAPVAAFGEGRDYLEGIRISVDAKDAFGVGPTGTAIREDRPVWCQDFLRDPLTLAWHESGARHGWAASASVPLHRDGIVVGALNLYAAKVDAFDADTRELLVEMATDISFALDGFEREAARLAGEVALKESEAFNQAILDSVTAEIAVLDRAGDILAVNEPWRRFALDNGAEPGIVAAQTGVGANYFSACRTAAGSEAVDASSAFEGIRAALEGRLPSFNLEYPCHSPQQQRWFSMNVTPLGPNRRGVVVAHSDITERRRAEESARQAHEQLRQLTTRLNSKHEAESSLLSRELHDEFGQLLTSLKMDLSWIASRCGGENPELARKVASGLALVDASVQSVRSIAARLRPRILDELGLLSAIDWLVQDFRMHHDIDAAFVANAEVDALPAEQATAVFRIAQESLSNIARHADAKRIDVSLYVRDGDLTLEVRDDGKGLPESHTTSYESIGLLGMRERALSAGGELTLYGVPGRGTVVSLRLPLAMEAA